MKSTLVLLSILVSSSAFAAHPCEKAVLRQAKEKLSSQVINPAVSVKSVEVQGDELIVFTLKVASSTRSGATKITELYEAKVDAACRINNLDVVPDSQVVDEQ